MDVAVCLLSFVNFNYGVEEFFFRNLDFFLLISWFSEFSRDVSIEMIMTQIAFEQEKHMSARELMALVKSSLAIDQQLLTSSPNDPPRGSPCAVQEGELVLRTLQLFQPEVKIVALKPQPGIILPPFSMESNTIFQQFLLLLSSGLPFQWGPHR